MYVPHFEQICQWFQKFCTSVDDIVLVAKLDSVENLLNASRRVTLRIKLARNDIFEQFAARYQIENHIMPKMILVRNHLKYSKKLE